MKKILQVVYFLIIIMTIGIITYFGFSFYNLPLEERFFHSLYKTLKPSGSWGHAFGIFGSLAMIAGVTLYMLRKRVKKFTRIGILKRWLEFHIFLCTLGPALILFHTSFKFGGIVSIAFWSMVAVVLSGVIGRFIYIQIPRSIQGQSFGYTELQNEYLELVNKIKKLYPETSGKIDFFENLENIVDFSKKNTLLGGIAYSFKISVLFRKERIKFKRTLNSISLDKKIKKDILARAGEVLTIKRKTETLRIMQKLFNYWHVAHLPFAIIMLIIMIIHVIVSVSFGYTWIF